MGQALEGAFDLVAPAGALGLVVIADVFAGLGAEDVVREALEVVSVHDEGVVAVHLSELATAGAEDEQVGDEHRAREEPGGQAVGRGEVVPTQHALAELRRGLRAAREEAGGHQEDAEAAGGEQVERTP